ncbi:hypothetical protein F4678DRAFT_199593 [Xylaria arbuscula]|nr:hypothetical protein F4678DRAFT_199593 [Xylaria arbuscula]
MKLRVQASVMCRAFQCGYFWAQGVKGETTHTCQTLREIMRTTRGTCMWQVPAYRVTMKPLIYECLSAFIVLVVERKDQTSLYPSRLYTCICFVVSVVLGIFE